MTLTKGLDALLATAQGRVFLLSNGIHADPATFRAALSPPRDGRLARESGAGHGPFVHMHQQIYLDYRASVMAKVLTLDTLAAAGIHPAFLWIDTDRAASDKLACRFYWPFDGALRAMKITPSGSDALETRFARVDPARTDTAYRRIAAYVRDGRVEAVARVEQLARLSSLRNRMITGEPMPLGDYGLGMTRAVFAAHLGIDHPYLIVSDMLAKGWLTSATEDILNVLPRLIPAWNARVCSLQADGIGTAVGLLPDDYLPLYVTDPRDGARLRLRHQIAGADHFATARAKDGRTHRFFLGTRRLRLDEVAATERWSPDVILPMLTNALFSGWVAGRSSALYALVFNKVLTDVLDERPIPILVPDCASGHGGDPDTAAASLLHAFHRHNASRSARGPESTRMTAIPESGIDILAFSPHPDDAEIGCSGALLLAAGAGQRTGIIDITDGDRATRGTPETRRSEREEAARRLGLATRVSLGLPDTLVAVDESALGRVVEVLRRLRPRLVLLPYLEDRHPDHGATTELVRRAVFLAGVRKTFEGPAHRVGAVAHYMIHEPFTPSFVIDVSSVWAQRCTVLEAHASQFGAHAVSGETEETALSHPSFMQALDARAVHYGAMIGAARGEPYWQPGPVPVHTLTDVIPATGGYRMFP